MECTVIQVDAFTKEPGQGNPAGVIGNGDAYTEEQMQQIAAAVGFNECVFICESEQADVRLRYFTPGHETPLCGHATMGAVFYLSQQEAADHEWTIETQAGIITVGYQHADEQMTMEQADVQFISFEGSRSKLCEAMGIVEEDLHEELPIVYGNTGSWTLLVPVKKKTVLDRMVPKTAVFPEVLTEMPRASIHPFAFGREADLYTARHFSSPFSGTVEDSVTGTASGVMGGYLLTHVYSACEEQVITVIQGKHVGRSGALTVRAERAADGHHHIFITGTACMNKALVVELE